jgi:hypothetical protein
VLPEFVAGDWKHQSDTPKEFRGQTYENQLIFRDFYI